MLSRMSFKEQWKEYRNRRNWLLCAGLGFLVVLPLADYLGHGVLQSAIRSPDDAFIASWRNILTAENRR